MGKLNLPKIKSSQLLARWQIIKKVIIDLFFPITCLKCGADDMLICSVCLSSIELRNFNQSWEKLVHQEYLDRIFIATWYENELVQEMIKRGKYQGQPDYFEILSWVLYKFWNINNLNDYFSESLTVLPIPLHRRRYFERGYNQSIILAQRFAELADYEVNTGLVRRVKYTKHQTKLNQARRQKNLSQAFKLNNHNLPKQVLLIDDVVTTGASLNEVARLLKAAGVEKVFALVIAKN